MTQKVEDALRRLEAQARTIVQKDDVAVLRGVIADCEENHAKQIERLLDYGDVMAHDLENLTMGSTVAQCWLSRGTKTLEGRSWEDETN